MFINIMVIGVGVLSNADVGTICCIILFLRFMKWLFGPVQETVDDYYYERYKEAQKRYGRRRK